MEIVELQDYPLKPGTARVWEPQFVHGSDAWKRDGRPPSAIHESHLNRSFHHPRRGGESWIGVAFDVRATLNPAAFASAMTTWIARHEALRTQVDMAANVDDPHRWQPIRHTLAPELVSVTSHTEVHFRDTAKLCAFLQTSLDIATSPFRWPAFSIITVERPDEFTVYLGADHSLLDGYSVLLTPRELTALYRQESGGGPAQLPDCGSYLDFSADERRSTANLGTADPAIALWSDYLARRSRPDALPEFPLPVTDTAQPCPAPQNSLVRNIFDARTDVAFAHACTEVGASYLGGLLACLALTSGELTGAPEFHAVLPISTRTTPYTHSIGWFVGISPLVLELGADPSFAALAPRATERYAGCRDAGRTPFSTVCEALALQAVPRFVVSYLDARHTPGAAAWPSANTRALRCRDYSPHDVYLWFTRTPDGMSLSARFPSSDVGTRNVHDYISHVRGVLENIRAVKGAFE